MSRGGRADNCVGSDHHGLADWLSGLSASGPFVTGLTVGHGDIVPRQASARESGMRMINPTTAITITKTTTLGSSKLWLATTSAAAALRWPVPSAMTRLVSTLRPPSSQPIPTPNTVRSSPARIPNVPKTCRILSMFAAVINNTSRIRLTLEIQSSMGFTRAANGRTTNKSMAATSGAWLCRGGSAPSTLRR